MRCCALEKLSKEMSWMFILGHINDSKFLLIQVLTYPILTYSSSYNFTSIIRNYLISFNQFTPFIFESKAHLILTKCHVTIKDTVFYYSSERINTFPVKKLNGWGNC